LLTTHLFPVGFPFIFQNFITSSAVVKQIRMKRKLTNNTIFYIPE